MSKYTQTKLDSEDLVFLQDIKHRIYKDGYKSVSLSKIIKYAVKKLENESYNSILKGMGAMNIINGEENLYDKT